MMTMMTWCLMSSDVSWHIRDKLRPMPKHGSIILYVHGNRRLVRTDSPGRPPRLSHSSWTMLLLLSWCLMSSDVIWHIRDKLWPMPKHGSIRKVYACLAVTCHLHFWQNDRDFLRATAVTRGWNGYRNKSQHRKSTLEKKILPPFQQGFEPATFQSRVRRSNHWAIPAPWTMLTCCNPFVHALSKEAGAGQFMTDFLPLTAWS